MPDYLTLTPSERDARIDTLERDGADPEVLVAWIAEEQDQGRATRFVGLLRPHITSLAEPKVIGLLDRLALSFPRVARRLAAAVAAADVQRTVAPRQSILIDTLGADVDPIVTFYRGEGRDAAGRSISDIWGWDDRRLEAVHDYIQWLFPTSHRSAMQCARRPWGRALTACSPRSGAPARQHYPRDGSVEATGGRRGRSWRALTRCRAMDSMLPVTGAGGL